MRARGWKSVLALSFVALGACRPVEDQGVDGGGGAGAGGAAGAAGGTGGASAPPSASGSCAAEASSNDDRAQATPYTLGMPIGGCLQSATDIDFYKFTVPSAPAQGGYVLVRITDVGPDGNVAATLFAGNDNGEFQVSRNVTDGGSVFSYFAARAGAGFLLKVTTYLSVKKPTPYTLTAVFNPVNDVNEPNDDNAHATPITVGQTVSGYCFAGHLDSTRPPDSAWDDRFKIALPAGPVTIALTDVPSDMNGMVTLYSPLGTELAVQKEVANGSSVVLKRTLTPAEAGDCIIKVSPYVALLKTSGEGSSVPASYQQPYTLKVTSP